MMIVHYYACAVYFACYVLYSLTAKHKLKVTPYENKETIFVFHNLGRTDKFVILLKIYNLCHEKK